ncbi:MAG: diphosphomevalonate/mevalonate 3,5-bisphosphate decarboxylase family protein [Schleiferiaceae bacterium]
MKSAFRAPSNIALVKYWGKYGVQLPSNPSISFTLDACATETTLELTETTGIRVALDGADTPSFVPKVAQFVERAATRHPWLKDYGLNVQTHNSFPHSSGIASSASGMSALALCVVDLARQLGHEVADPKQEASILARLGSGSACRSVYGGLVVWGETPSVPGSSQDYGVEYPHEVHDVFRSYRDVVALVDVGQKAVSSTAGHQLMEQHPFRAQRFAQAHDHLAALGPILASGDLEAFMELVELEALTLHGLMMSSSPSYILMRPNTLRIIEAIRGFRRETGTPISFTLDAGANVHILFPEHAEQSALQFVEEQVNPWCKDGRAIADRVGQGPVSLL